MQTKLSAKSQCHGQTQQTRQNPNEDPVNHAGHLGSPSDDEAHHKRQQHLQPRQQAGADPSGKVIDGTLIRRTPNLKSQDKRIAGNQQHQDKKTHANNCQRSGEDAGPSDTG